MMSFKGTMSLYQSSRAVVNLAGGRLFCTFLGIDINIYSNHGD